MPKFGLTLVILATFFHSHSQSTASKITQNYFRSDPFRMEFSAFLKHLMNDPGITDKLIEKRSDTTLFYFQGLFNNHKPFFFKPDRVQVILAEVPVAIDTSRTDTVFAYQLLAYNKATKEGVQEVKKEFERIHKRFKNGFAKSSLIENSRNLANATYNYFDALHVVAPFALTWTMTADSTEVCLILTVRMSVDDNKATLPIPFYGF